MNKPLPRPQSDPRLTSQPPDQNAPLDLPLLQFVGHALDLYARLAQGCRVHPMYRARRSPSKQCQWCLELWLLRVNEFDTAQRTLRLVAEALAGQWPLSQLEEKLCEPD